MVNAAQPAKPSGDRVDCKLDELIYHRRSETTETAAPAREQQRRTELEELEWLAQCDEKAAFVESATVAKSVDDPSPLAATAASTEAATAVPAPEDELQELLELHGAGVPVRWPKGWDARLAAKALGQCY